MVKAVVSVVAALAASMAAGGDLLLAERGAPESYAIVVPASAGASVRYAAEELRDHVRMMTGTEMPIVTNETDATSASLPEKAIVLEVVQDGFTRSSGSTRLDNQDAFRLHVEGRRLFVTGGVRGVLYGVYELLETYGGVGWFASWRTIVPESDRFSVPEDLDVEQWPAFAMRHTSWFDVIRNPAFAARLRLNGGNGYSDAISAGAEGEKFGGASFRFGRGMGACHTFKSLLPPERHFKEHPEWFSEVGGKRKDAPTQLCLTNPDVLRIVTSNVLEHIRRDPGARFFGVSQDDWNWFCTCANCAAVDEEEGSHSGTIVRFVNAIAEEVEKEFPDVFIETLAYTYSRKPPKITKPRRNVVPCLCTIECEFNKPLGESDDPANRSFEEDIRGWAAITDNLYLWDYTTNFRNYLHLLPNVLTLGPNLRFFRDNGVKFAFEQANRQGLHADFAELKAWLTAKLLWNPDQPVEPLLDRFFEGYYGAAAPFVRRYFDEAQALGRAADVGHWGIYSDIDDTNVPDAFLARATNLWALATEAVKDDPALSYNVRMGAASPLYTIAARSPAGCAAWVSRGRSRPDLEGTRLIVGELLDCQEASGNRIRWSEGLRAHELRDHCFRQFMALEKEPRYGDSATIDAETLAICRWDSFKRNDKRAVLVDDCEAIGGKALKFLPTSGGWTVRLDTSGIGYDVGAKLHIRVHAKVAKKPDGHGKAFWAGVHDAGKRESCGESEFDVSDIGDGYQWYDILEWMPEGNQYFWMGAVPFDTLKHAESPAHDGVFVDAVEISVSDCPPPQAAT